jgi:hypothetical protein
MTAKIAAFWCSPIGRVGVQYGLVNALLFVLPFLGVGTAWETLAIQLPLLVVEIYHLRWMRRVADRIAWERETEEREAALLDARRSLDRIHDQMSGLIAKRARESVEASIRRHLEAP